MNYNSENYKELLVVMITAYLLPIILFVFVKNYI